MTRYRGFTLIELLFVIAVLGLLSTTSILFYQQYMREQKIKKTVAQMMQWQQAGMAYYVKNKKWPIDTATLINNGYMPPGAAGSSPWCTGVCYTVQQASNQAQLFQVTAHNLPPAPIVGGGVPGAIAARLTYTQPVSAQATSVTGIINIPLAGLAANPDLIVVDLVPFVLKGSDVTFTSIGSGENRFFKTSTFLPNKVVFPCAERYGKNYSFMPYVIVSSYNAGDVRAGSQGNVPQPLVFSLVEIRAEARPSSDQRILLVAVFRPQIYTRSGGFGKDISSLIPGGAEKNLEVKGQVSFVCCKPGISCSPQPRIS